MQFQVAGLCFTDAEGIVFHHDLGLVALSYLIAVGGSYAALEMIERWRNARSAQARYWQLASAAALGGSIWSMHFVAMLALKIDFPLTYSPVMTLLSLLIAIGVVWCGLQILEPDASRGRICCAGIMVGLGVAAMHYVGMAAVRFPGHLAYTPSLWSLSLLVGIATATVALWLSLTLQQIWQRALAALAMGAAICGMHFTGMASTVFLVDPLAQVVPGLPRGPLVAAVTLATLALILCSLAFVTINRRILASTMREAAALRRSNEKFARANAELELGRRQFDAVVNNISQGVCLFDAERRLILSNRRYAELYGLAPDQIRPGMRLEEILALRAALGADPIMTMEEYVAWTPAHGKPFTVFGAVIPLKNGRIVSIRHQSMRDGGYVATHEDITERRQIEDHLRLSEERFRSIFNAISDGFFIVEPKTGAYLEINESGKAMFGYGLEELRGKTIGDLSSGIPPYTRREIEALIEKSALTGKQQILDWHCKGKDGQLFWAEISLHIASIANREVVLSVVRDITQRQAIEGQLRQAQKMEAVGQLTGGLAHDFNNLLAVVQGNLELLRDQDGADSTSAGLIDEAVKAVERGASLTHRLLAYSRQQQLNPSAVDVGVLVIGLVGMLRRVVEESIAIDTDIAPGLWTSRIDSHQLENALLNLTVNARDAMPDGGTLTIAAENVVLDEDQSLAHDGLAPGRYIVLTISDTGMGMPKHVVERALEPFFTTKSVGQGTGLGLSMVYGFVKQSGGHLTIYSEPGLGTVVKLYLPEFSSDQAFAAIEESKPVPAAVGEPVILVVEDDDLMRRLQLRLIGALHYRTLEATDGPSALAALEGAARVDLLLTDVVLPGGMSGPALADAARRVRPGLKVVFMSGYAPIAITQRYNLSGARVVAKPFTRSALAHAIREALEEVVSVSEAA
jgi:PAS domain S-box-containing protein